MKNYPIKDGPRTYYAMVPVQITKKKMPGCMIKLKLGKWMAVNIHTEGVGGYSAVPSPVMFDTEAECQKGCDVHNSYHGWKPTQVEIILGMSMAASMKARGEAVTK